MRSIGGWGVGYGNAIDAEGECANRKAIGGWRVGCGAAIDEENLPCWRLLSVS